MYKFHHTYQYLGNLDLDNYRRKRIPRNIIWGILLFLGISTIFYLRGTADLLGDGRDESLHLNLDIRYKGRPNEQTETRCHGQGGIAGGLPGFYVFDQIWYKSGEFYIFTDQPDQITLPPLDAISIGKNPVNVRPLAESPSFDNDDPDAKGVMRCYHDETIWMNVAVPTYSPPISDQDENEKFDRRVMSRSLHRRFNWEFHHYHFLAESLLGGIASLDLVRAGNNIVVLPSGSGKDNEEEKDYRRQVDDVERYSAYGINQEIYDRQWLFIPWEEDWKDGYGLNEPVVNGLFDHRFVDAQRWNESTYYGDWVGFERVVVIDRWSSHLYNTLANQWNKMALDVFSLLPTTISSTPSLGLGVRSIFSPYRDRFLGYMNIQSLHRHRPGTALHEIPKIVYVDRQSSSRRLLNGTHDDLLDVLDGLGRRGKAKIQVGRLEEMNYENQIRLFADADIIIGVHGNGLTHQMWMPPGGIIIEIFPPGVFLRDYQLIAQVVGHEHIAILNSQIYTKQEWENEPGKLLASRPDEANDRNITLSKDFIEDLLYLKLTNYQVVL